MHAFESYQNQWPWMTYERPKRNLAEKWKNRFRAHQKKIK